MGIGGCGSAGGMATKKDRHVRDFRRQDGAQAKQLRKNDLRRRKCPRRPYPRFTSDITTGRSAFVTVRVTTSAGR
jgi:hypothetical protein